MIAGDGASVPPAFHIPGEHRHQIAVGQIWVPHARIGIAFAAGDQQVGMLLHCPPGKGFQQRCFAPAGATGNEYHPALSGQCFIDERVQLRQLALSSDKERPLILVSGLFSAEKGGKLWWEVQFPGLDLLAESDCL